MGAHALVAFETAPVVRALRVTVERGANGDVEHEDDDSMDRRDDSMDTRFEADEITAAAQPSCELISTENRQNANA